MKPIFPVLAPVLALVLCAANAPGQAASANLAPADALFKVGKFAQAEKMLYPHCHLRAR